MSFAGPTFVLAIIAMSMIAWVITTAIRARHGYPLTDDWGGRVDKQDPLSDDRTAALQSQNGELKSEVARLAERIQVLERIATDRGIETAAQIEALRTPVRTHSTDEAR